MRALLALLLFAVSGVAAAEDCRVWLDADGDGRRDRGEPGLQGIKVSDGRHVVTTDAKGRYRLPGSAGREVFVIKPAGYSVPVRGNGLPDFWRPSGCGSFGLQPRAQAAATEVLVFSDTQVKSAEQIGYYRRDIVEPLIGKTRAAFGITLGDLVDDQLALYPQLDAVTTLLGVPWLHVPGNHDIDFEAGDDAGSLRSFRGRYGPDTFAWEEQEAVFIGLDDVIYLPGRKPAYVGGLREDQFAFLEAYLPQVPKEKLLVLGVHIPFFDAAPGRESFRHADRARLFALLKDFPHVLLLSGHSHTQQHVRHDARSGWHGDSPLHEYNVGAVCGAYWSGVGDARGLPDATMSDGTPNGHATLRVGAGGGYALAWHPAREPDSAIALHAPRVLRQGAYPAWGVYANVFMGEEDTRVEYRVDGGEWMPMRKVVQPDPALLAENARDDLAEALRGFDRSPEATPSAHLWRGALPTGLDVGEHTADVRAFDRWRGELGASTRYRLQAAPR